MADGGKETAAVTPSAEDPVGPPVGAEGEGEGEGDAVGHAEVAGDGEASGELPEALRQTCFEPARSNFETTV